MAHVAVEYGPTKAKVWDPYLLRASENGGYFLKNLVAKKTRYEGLYMPITTDDGWELVKSFHDIVVDKELVAFDPSTDTLVFKDGSTQRFQVGKNGIVCDLKGADARLIMDCHLMYDYEEFARIYQRKDKNNLYLFTYKKSGTTNYTYYLAVKTTLRFTPSDRWYPESYELDIRRNAPPTSLHVYEAGTLKGDGRIVCAFGTTPKEAISTAQSLWKAQAAPKKFPEDYLETALLLANDSLDALTIKRERTTGIYAGLPWFYQWWTRDEAISLGALIRRGEFKQAKTMLLRQSRHMLDDGRIANRYPHSELGSADGIGWFATRMLELLQQAVFTKREMESLFDTLLNQKEHLENNYLRDDLIWNAPLETWMDTGMDIDKRDGACIEIQLLHQKVNDLLAELARHTTRVYQPVDRLPMIRQRFFNGECLRDRITNDGQDDTVRPNLFFAYYLYPELLSQEEWTTTFSTAIKKLWTAWGGFTTIQTDSPLFHIEYTGQNNYSYHRGDVWYFVNNIAALCLHRCDPERFRPYVETIHKASAREILFSGALGHAAEISSAKQPESQGCLMQAWSAATFIELAIALRSSR